MNKKKWILSAFVCLMLTLSVGTTAFAAKTAAKIGNKKYATLQTAVDKVKKGQTIKVVANITTDEPLEIGNASGRKFTIDFGGKEYKYTGEGYAIRLQKGTVTLKNASLTADNLIQTAKGTKLTIPNGTYRGIMITNLGTAVITGGTFKGTGSTAKELMRERALLDNYGTMTVSGGSFHSGKNTTIENRGTIRISGGTFSTKVKMYGSATDGMVLDNRGKAGGAVSDKGATAVITGGTFSSTYLLSHNCGTLTVKAGTFASKKFNVFCNAEGKIIISGGDFKSGGTGVPVLTQATAKTTVSGGTFTSKNTVASGRSGGTTKITGGTFTSTSAKEAVLSAVDGAAISVTGGQIVGKKTYAWFATGGGKVTIGKKVKVDTKYGQKKQ